MHWGLYSVPAHGNEWYGRYMYGTAVRQLACPALRPADQFGYKDFIPMFTARQVGPGRLGRAVQEGRRQIRRAHRPSTTTASRSGTARYNRFNAMKMGPKRDLIGDLAKAVRNKGLKFGVSNHSIEHYTFIHPQR